mmetsp:Transcript_15561/g.17950  ORF Transcript_15561/g.17950 Transcript_15561/m.17950 type:complete len:203 (-) Transcript_15561:9-617(-)
MKSQSQHFSNKHVFMYCTGGVRCERASECLEGIMSEEPPKGIYQLSGGIQKYLEKYGKKKTSTTTSMQQEEEEEENHPTTTTIMEDNDNDDICLYRGKNFVFDPRRTDGVVGKTTEVVGRCSVCQTLHDDYDNGHAPCQNKEARCCRCRILLLVCNDCRQNKVRCWGEDETEHKQDLFCGGKEGCIDQGNNNNTVQEVEIII